MHKQPYSLLFTSEYFDKVGWWLSIANYFDREAYESFILKADLDNGKIIFELGPGTGMLAWNVLAKPNSIDTWLLAEASQVLQSRLQKRFSMEERTSVFHVRHPPPFPFDEGSFDRFVACFVLDCMDSEAQRCYLKEAHRLLKSNGTICIMSVTNGQSVLSRLIMSFGNQLSNISPAFALGARFNDPASVLESDMWDVVTNYVFIKFGFATRIVIAKRCDLHGSSS